MRMRNQEPHIHLRLKIRRTAIKPAEKREEYIRRLESIIGRLEEIINSDATSDKLRISAVNALTRVIKAAYGMVKDIEMEEFERELDELERKIEEVKEERGGYW